MSLFLFSCDSPSCFIILDNVKWCCQVMNCFYFLFGKYRVIKFKLPAGRVFRCHYHTVTFFFFFLGWWSGLWNDMMQEKEYAPFGTSTALYDKHLS